MAQPCRLAEVGIKVSTCRTVVAWMRLVDVSERVPRFYQKGSSKVQRLPNRQLEGSYRDRRLRQTWRRKCGDAGRKADQEISKVRDCGKLNRDITKTTCTQKETAPY